MSGVYDEGILRNEVDKIQVYDAYIQIFCTDRMVLRIKGHTGMAESVIY